MRLVVAAVLSVALLAACERTDPLAPLPPPPPMVAGGSNYVTYSVGSYLEQPSEEVWYRPGELRPVIGTFHLDSARVKSQLAEMFANGQRRLALVLWYDDFLYDLTLSGRDVHGHIVDSSRGRLSPVHEANLRRVLDLVQEAGYQEVVFRFATQHGSRPLEWRAWNEARYRKNWSFVSSTIDVVDEVLEGGALSVLYDLDVELGGIHHLGQGKRYAVRMWGDYLRRYGARRSVGFSIPAGGAGIVRAAIGAFDDAGARPPVYAVDLYGDEYTALQRVSYDMRRAGEGAKPVIVQELFYNDETSAAEVCRAYRELGLHIRYVLQWPWVRNAGFPHFSVHYPASFDAYRPMTEC